VSSPVTTLVSIVGRIVITVIVQLGFFATLGIVLTQKVTGNATPEILLLMLGALTAKWGDSVVYWIGSSAGSSDKDSAQQATTDRLVEAVATSAPVAAMKKPWWGQLTDAEKAAIQAKATDPKVKDFMDHASAGTATPEELSYVVSQGLLTQDRAAALT
jgi:hypothetical protein